MYFVAEMYCTADSIFGWMGVYSHVGRESRNYDASRLSNGQLSVLAIRRGRTATLRSSSTSKPFPEHHQNTLFT